MLYGSDLFFFFVQVLKKTWQELHNDDEHLIVSLRGDYKFHTMDFSVDFINNINFWTSSKMLLCGTREIEKNIKSHNKRVYVNEFFLMVSLARKNFNKLMAIFVATIISNWFVQWWSRERFFFLFRVLFKSDKCPHRKKIRSLTACLFVWNLISTKC